MGTIDTEVGDRTPAGMVARRWVILALVAAGAASEIWLLSRISSRSDFPVLDAVAVPTFIVGAAATTWAVRRDLVERHWRWPAVLLIAVPGAWCLAWVVIYATGLNLLPGGWYWAS